MIVKSAGVFGLIAGSLMRFLLFIPARPSSAAEPIRAEVSCSLDSELPHIRQLVLDGDRATAFISAKNIEQGSRLTISFEHPVAIRSIEVVAAEPDGKNSLEHATLETSNDGQEFRRVADFQAGSAKAAKVEQPVQAVRILCQEAAAHPLAIAEIMIDSEPSVLAFKYPVEFVLDCTGAPDLKDWLTRAAEICDRSYTMINEELASEGFRPARVIRMAIRSNYRGVAATSGDRIVGSAAFFKRHPDDFGAMVHETIHVVQHYTHGDRPGWLVEGIADYVRFFKYEPGKLGRINPERAQYDHAYRESAAFLAYLVEHYDPLIVKKLNTALRTGTYKDELFETWTKKPLKQLGDEWKASLRGGATGPVKR